MKTPSIHRTLAAIGYWLEHGKDSVEARQHLVRRRADLVAIIAHREDAMPTEVRDVLDRDYLGRWIEQVLDREDGPITKENNQ